MTVTPVAWREPPSLTWAQITSEASLAQAAEARIEGRIDETPNFIMRWRRAAKAIITPGDGKRP